MPEIRRLRTCLLRTVLRYYATRAGLNGQRGSRRLRQVQRVTSLNFSLRMEFIIKIEKIINNGMGLARPAGGKILMVPGVLPGEKVKVSTRKEFRGHIEADLDEVLSASSARIAPPCPWYADCGGCDLQHADYGSQLAFKSAFLSEAMTRAGVVCESAVPSTALASPNQLNYRYRIRLKIDKNGRIGFFRKQTNSVVALSSCPVATKKMNAALAFVHNFSQTQATIAMYNELELLHSPAHDTITLLLAAGKNQKTSPELLTALTNCPEIDQVAFKIDGKINTDFQLKPLGQIFSVPLTQENRNINYTLTWSADCFSQVNANQNERLVQLVCELAGDMRGKTALDLYCGMGNFSIALALSGATVTGLELNSESINWAERNAGAAGVNCRFYVADVPTSLRELANDRQQIDTVILDPPRKGLDKGTRSLAKLNARQILYISCDPATLSRDVALLTRSGYQLKQLIPVDMFPQTHHIESVALLKKIDIAAASH
ncbi:MAG: 23S rRNA (uracil(1939)-C(5))-methyltransferase RlmD [Desulfobulbus sp.]|nr:MAG: 23S rRNA (uracil(1939)-C(5))-methyltransferase RlmD [Desulfobulbus sp.]